MKLLKDLNPWWADDGVLGFDCPTCEPEKAHICGVPTKEPFTQGGPVWSWNGERDFEKVTLNPSIDYTKSQMRDCKFHGWVRDGKVTWL